VEKARELLGFEAKTSFKKGIECFVKWLGSA
jgi:nucleoside-diphosphate-sugar epimerase